MSIFGWSLPPGCSHLPYDDDFAEACPECNKENSVTNVNGDVDWICKEAPEFCSVDCLNKYTARQREEDDAFAKAIQEEERLAAEYNSKYGR